MVVLAGDMVPLFPGEKLITGTRFLKKNFAPGSGPSKRELARGILAGDYPGWVEGGTEDGTPYVYEDTWKEQRRRQNAPDSPETPTPTAGLFLFQQDRL